MKKHIIYLILLNFILIFILSGCSRDARSNEGGTTSATTHQDSEELTTQEPAPEEDTTSAATHEDSEEETTQEPAPEEDTAAANDNDVILRTLDKDSTYTDLDLNNDGEEDTFVIGSHDSGSGNLPLTLNGDDSEIFLARGGDVYYYKYDSRNEYLIAVVGQFGGSELTIHRYDGTELKEISSLYVLDRNHLDSAEGNTIYLETSPYKTQSLRFFRIMQTEDDTVCYFLVPYELDPDTHTFSLASPYADIKEPKEVTYTKEQEFPTSTSPENIDRDGLVLEPGEKYTVSRMYITRESEGDSYTSYFQVEKEGKTGWVREDDTFE